MSYAPSNFYISIVLALGLADGKTKHKAILLTRKVKIARVFVLFHHYIERNFWHYIIFNTLFPPEKYVELIS